MARESRTQKPREAREERLRKSALERDAHRMASLDARAARIPPERAERMLRAARNKLERDDA